MKVKLINLNLLHGGQFWDNIVAYLRTEQPDLLFLQEAYADPTSPMPRLNTVPSLQQLFDYPFAEYETQFILHEGSDHAPMGSAILSKFPLAHKQVVWLKGNGPVDAYADDKQQIPTFPRNLLHCQTTINGASYHLITLQGVWAPDSIVTADQREMAERVAAYVAPLSNVIMAGDFNVKEGTTPINLISQQVVNIFEGERISSFNMKHKTNPGYATAVVDFVFASPSVKVREHYTPEVDVSDHQSQVVVFDL